MSAKESSVSCSVRSSGAMDFEASVAAKSRTQSARSVICMADSSAMFLPCTVTDRADSLSRVPPQSGQGRNTMARSTKARTCDCIDSTSLASMDLRILVITPSYVTLMPSTLIFVASRYSRSSSSCSVYSPSGLSMSKYPDPAKMRPYQPSIE